MARSSRLSSPFQFQDAQMPLPSGAGVAITASVPAPIGGLNAQDSIAQMPKTDALIMDNFFPQPSYVQLRNGYSQYATGMPGMVSSIFTYLAGATSKIFGVSTANRTDYTGGSIYDCTAGGAVGAAAVTGLTNAQWEYTNFSTAGGNYLMACNATDSPLLYNGSTWQSVTGVSAPIAITGVTTSTLRCPTPWKNRLWFIQDGTLTAWYLPTSSIGGAAQLLDLRSLFPMGGQLQTIFTPSLQDSQTTGGYIAFMTTMGEIALYQGTDPASSGTFALIGVYRIGQPLGRRCTFKVGGDIMIICQDGVYPFSKVMQDTEDRQTDAISFKIVTLIQNDANVYINNFGWQGLIYPIGNKIIINVPESTISSGYTAHQYVMNTVTNAWCRFTNWNAACFDQTPNALLFGADGYVAKADSGPSDNGGTIAGTIKPAFNYFGTKRQKQFTMVRPVVQSNGTIGPALNINTDFSDVLPTAFPTFSGGQGGAWNTSAWNTTPWAVGDSIQKNWITVNGTGFCATIYLQISSNKLQVKFHALDWVFQTGAVL